MSYNEETLEWLEKRSNVNMLRHYKDRLEHMSISLKHKLLLQGLIKYQNNYLGLTEKGRSLLEERRDK